MPPSIHAPQQFPGALLKSHRCPVWALERGKPSAQCWALHSTTSHSTTGTKEEAQEAGALCHAQRYGPKERNGRGHWCCARTKCSSPQQRSGSSAHTHAHYTHSLLRVQGAACSQVLPHAHTYALTRSSSQHRGPYTLRRLPQLWGELPMHPLCTPCHPSLPGQHSKVHLETSARKPAGQDCCGSAPFPSSLCLILRKLIPKFLRPQCAYREYVGAPLGLLADGGGCVGGSNGLNPQLPLADARCGGHRGGVVTEGSSTIGSLGQNGTIRDKQMPGGVTAETPSTYTAWCTRARKRSTGLE